jgi:hypothetical protein
MYGAGMYRMSDLYLAMTPAASFSSGLGTLYFAGLTNDQPAWTTTETDAVPVIQDNAANQSDYTPSVGNMCVNYSTNLGLWLMTYDGGRNATPITNHVGIYFSFATRPWGPWSKPQLIYNKYRDGGNGTFIYDSQSHTGPAGPTINPTQNNPTKTPGDVYAAYMIESFASISNSTLSIYYTMATWNPYTVVKMRSQFSIVPRIDPGAIVLTKTNCSFSWSAPTNIIYQVDYATNLTSAWTTLTNLITSTNGVFNFTDNGINSGGFGTDKLYRLRAPP